MQARMNRQKILVWSIAWAVTGIGLLSADVFSVPRHGHLWIGIMLGVISWSVAGALTFPQVRISRSLTVWAIAYLAAFWLGAIWGDWFEHNTVGSISSAGFIGALLGWAVGASLGVMFSANPRSRHTRLATHLAESLAWGISFLIGGFFALIAATFLGQLAAVALPFARQIAFYVGWGCGCASGGALAAGLALTARSLRWSHAPSHP